MAGAVLEVRVLHFLVLGGRRFFEEQARFSSSDGEDGIEMISVLDEEFLGLFDEYVVRLLLLRV
jgi:hypothetical protein